ncbi:Hypothetical cytosolic protein [Lactobacillus helveticus H10]|nr:Hypothetical cytosolic protein [Lactobacillus helveticus H10]
MKKMIGISSDGKKFSVLTSRIFNRTNPEQVIKKPPTMEISVTSGSVKKLADKNLATR